MFSRIWHGWTTRENACRYEFLLKTEIFVGIQDRRISGYRGIELFRRTVQDEVEFITVMFFDTMEAIRASAGEDYEVAVVPPKARNVDWLVDYETQTKRLNKNAEAMTKNIPLNSKRAE